ncbi:MAG TPA: GNAT family N-acetyltransferase [Streptosporangiaceae bacterium]|nr:GNAT family N-acetyltransferase [Streptosporangiaceae bacterium]
MADVPVTVRPLHRGDNYAADLDLNQRAFGPSDPAGNEQRLASVRLSIDGGRYFGALRGDDVIGTARFLDMVQCWHGRLVPMAGVAGVKVAPEARGGGTGRALTAALLAEIEARGYPLSALYPATAPLYRSFGYEIAGGRYQVTLPGRSLHALLPPEPGPAGQDTLRRSGPADAAEISAVIERSYSAARVSGPVNHDLATSTLLLDDEDVYCYLGDDAFVCYGWSAPREITVYFAVACTAAATRAVWSLIASHVSIAETVHAVAGPADPIGWLTAEPDVRLQRTEEWMLRVISAPAAIATRGFPAGLTASVPLTLADPQFPANAGTWRLTVGDGRGALARGPGAPGAPLRLGPRGLAALYAGTPLATLRMAGLAAGGDPGADTLLDAAFAATPYMLDRF